MILKKGRIFRMKNGYTNYNVTHGTVDSQNPKSLYISISAWGEPKQSTDINYTNIIRSLDKKINQYIYSNLGSEFVPKRSIIDLDIRESGIQYGKRSYMHCEITVFQSSENPKYSNNIKKEIEGVANKVIKEVFDVSEYFDFHKKKN